MPALHFGCYAAPRPYSESMYSAAAHRASLIAECDDRFGEYLRAYEVLMMHADSSNAMSLAHTRGALLTELERLRSDPAAGRENEHDQDLLRLRHRLDRNLMEAKQILRDVAPRPAVTLGVLSEDALRDEDADWFPDEQ